MVATCESVDRWRQQAAPCLRPNAATIARVRAKPTDLKRLLERLYAGDQRGVVGLGGVVRPGEAQGAGDAVRG